MCYASWHEEVEPASNFHQTRNWLILTYTLGTNNHKNNARDKLAQAYKGYDSYTGNSVFLMEIYVKVMHILF